MLINLPPLEFKHHHLCALSHLLRWIPKQVLLSEVPRVSADSSLRRVVACEARLSLTWQVRQAFPNDLRAAKRPEKLSQILAQMEMRAISRRKDVWCVVS